MLHSKGRLRLIILLPLSLLGIGVFVWLNYRLMTQVDYPNIDWSCFYTGGKIVAQGGNPYDVVTYQGIYDLFGRTRVDSLNRVLTYPLYSALVFMPFSFFSIDWSTTLWTIFSELCLALTFWLLLQTLLIGQKEKERERDLRWLLLWGLLLFLPSRPLSKALLDGQVSFFLTLLAALFIYAAAHRRYNLAGLALLVGLFKPTIFVLLVPLGLLWLLKRERRRGLYTFLLSGLILLAIAFMLRPGWVGEWLGARTGEGWDIMRRLATVWGTASALTEAWGVPGLFPVLALSLTFALLGGAWYFWYTKPVLRANPVLCWGILAALSIYLSSYALSYESVVLIIPLMGILGLIRRYPSRQKTLVLVGLALLMLFIPWLLSPLTTPLDEITAGITPLTMVLFGWLVLLLNPSRSKLDLERPRLALGQIISLNNGK
jgi:hypothetical protein